MQNLRQRNQRELANLKAQLDGYDKAGRSSETKILRDKGQTQQQASFFHRYFKIVGQVGEPGQQGKLRMSV